MDPPHIRLLLAMATTPEQRRFALGAWLLAPVVELSLRVVGLERTLRWIEKRPTGPPRPSVELPEGARLVTRVYRFHFVRGACLPQSLLQYWLHRRDGTPARFVIGVRRATGTNSPKGIEAHAWVEPLTVAREGSPETHYDSLLTRPHSAMEHAAP